MGKDLTGLIILLLALAGASAVYLNAPPTSPWSDAERKAIQSLSLDALPPLPSDPSNAVANHPVAQDFGHRLFFDARLSANGAVSCATCHQPALRFTDGLPRAVGLAIGTFNTMSLVGAAYSPWFFWNGRQDSLWAQATSPLESPIEQGVSRAEAARLIAGDPIYLTAYETLFGPLPPLPSKAPATEQEEGAVTETFANITKAIAAYERLLLPGETRFDRYAASLGRDGAKAPDARFSHQEAEGLRLFIGKAQCINCHNGPLFTNHEFHNTGVLPAIGALPDKGRAEGARLVLKDPFNCFSVHSDDSAKDCPELRFMRTGDDLVAAQKTPSLRNLEGTAPYMHAGQLGTLAEALDHYNRARNAIVGHNEAKPLGLLPYELKRLEAFLNTLDGPLATAPEWLAPP
ncbi:MAG: cytochrome-c peroxidase [Gammaproteobacteria bacterium]|nr:cytochrome-c peroxidase [Gammaproteobacteria bacterium]